MGYTAIIDYGVGNLKSVSNAFAYVGVDTRITSNAKEIELADAILLPGVGAFPNAADKLRAPGLDKIVLEQGRSKPVLGICLGMQLLLEQGTEVRPCQGLGVIRGVCDRIPTSLKLPHIGWNSLRFPNPSPLFAGIDEGACVYFVHSFSAQNCAPEQVVAVTDHGCDIVAAVNSGNFFGCQFHPEKSGEVGLQILKNFGAMNK